MAEAADDSKVQCTDFVCTDYILKTSKRSSAVSNTGYPMVRTYRQTGVARAKNKKAFGVSQLNLP